MKYIIEVGLEYNDGDSASLGYIGSIKYSFIEKASRGEVKYIDRHGDVAINKMFSLSHKKDARVYNTEAKVDEDISLLRKNFTGLHYVFCKIRIDDDTAKAIRKERK
jgi:hypothetical protein